MRNRLPIISAKPTIQNHSENHESNVSAGPVSRCSAALVAARPIDSHSPTARKSQPTAFAGRSATMTGAEDGPDAHQHEHRSDSWT